MERILGFIITVVLVCYLLKIVFRLLMPLAARYFMKRMAKKMGGDGIFFGQEAYANEEREEGDISIHSRPQRKKSEMKETMEEGDYVDYEEVK